MVATAPTWNEITAAGRAMGLHMDEWEEELHDRLITYIISHTKSVERYHTDPVFHTEVMRLVGLVVGCILEHSPLVDPALRKRAADFDVLFQQGAQEGRPPA